MTHIFISFIWFADQVRRQTSSTFTILEPNSSEPQYVKEGSSVLLSCGNHDFTQQRNHLSLTWKRGSNFIVSVDKEGGTGVGNIPDPVYYRNYQDGRFVFFRYNGTLVINNLKLTDSGYIYCSGSFWNNVYPSFAYTMEVYGEYDRMLSWN